MTVAAPPQTGDVLDGRYRLVELSGSGGMAHVYRAHDLSLDRVVAVKVMHAQGAAQSGHERIRAEVRLLASVSGHSLVTLLDARVADDAPSYLVMEYIDGPTLSARLSAGRLPLPEIDQLAQDLADALHEVHAAGIVHRDVKPSNVLLSRPSPTRPYRAKLTDFGIAHLLDSTRVTTPGLTVGTAAYIAPELLDGADPLPPADIYALGLVLLEAATGRRAFGTTDARAEVLARLTRDPDIPASLGPARRRLLTRMTSREPSERPDAAELLALLAALPAAASVDMLAEDTAPLAIASPSVLSEVATTRPYAIEPPVAEPPVAAASRGRPRRRVGVRAAGALIGTAAAAALVAATWSTAAPPAPTEPAPDATTAVDTPAQPTPAATPTAREQPVTELAGSDDGAVDPVETSESVAPAKTSKADKAAKAAKAAKKAKTPPGQKASTHPANEKAAEKKPDPGTGKR